MLEETYTTSGIILKREPYQENDSRVLVYTPNFGKLELIARGTRKLSSKMAAHIEPFNLVNLMVIKGRRRKYLGSAIARDAHQEIKNDLDKLYSVGRVFNFFNKTIREEASDPHLFNLLHDFLKIIGQTKNNPELLEDFFTLKFLNELGYRPELYACLGCQQEIMPGNNFFSPERGGLLCKKCSNISENNENLTISDDCIKIMKFALKNDFPILNNLQINDNLKKELKNKIFVYLQFNP